MGMFLRKQGAVDAGELAEVIFGRSLSDDELKHHRCIWNNLKTSSEKYKYITELFMCTEGFSNAEKNVLETHLLYGHNSRVKMVRRFLPAAEFILDIGSANFCLYDFGYPHTFNQMICLDLPPEERCDEYKDIQLKDRIVQNGVIRCVYGNATDLSEVDDDSIDLVWLGQVVEHITREDAEIMYKEVNRVLKPGGVFCLDTPNRIITRIHTNWSGGGFVHPEHKYEYEPSELKGDLENSGFAVKEAVGVCQMPTTFCTGEFNYDDFLYGNTFSDNIDECYFQFYKCVQV